MSVCSSFIDLHAAVQFSQHHLLKILSFSHFRFLPPLSKINWPDVWILRVPVVAQWKTNPTRNHEVAGLIPGLPQWVKDLALP